MSMAQESYQTFRERTFGDDMFIVHDGGPNITPFTLWNKSGSEAEKTYARTMLMRGLAEGDTMALLGLAELRNNDVLNALKAALPHGNADVTLEIVRFLLDHDAKPDYATLKMHLLPLLDHPHTPGVNARNLLSRMPAGKP